MTLQETMTKCHLIEELGNINIRLIIHNMTTIDKLKTFLSYQSTNFILHVSSLELPPGTKKGNVCPNKLVIFITNKWGDSIR